MTEKGKRGMEVTCSNRLRRKNCGGATMGVAVE